MSVRRAGLLAAFLLGGVVLALASLPTREPRGGAQTAEPLVAYQPRSRYLPDGHYAGPSVARTGRPLNLVVVVVDTLRDDCVWRGADHAGDMPFLATLAKRGARLLEVTAPTAWTCPSLASLFTARTPDRHGVVQDPYAPTFAPGLPTWAEIMVAHGYETAAFSELVFPRAEGDLFEGFGLVQLGRPFGPMRPLVEAWDKARDRERPYFLLLHAFDAHDPYGQANHPWPHRRPTPEALARVGSHRDYTPSALAERFMTDYSARVAFLQEGREHTVAALSRYLGRGFAADPDVALARRLETAYRVGVRWVDTELEATLALLERRGLLENTLLVITSDHGEAFGEHGVLAHGRQLHEELLHVPLVAIGPEPFRGGKRIRTSIGLVDLMPTFLELAGFPGFTQGEGRSMLEELRADSPGRAVISMDVLTPWKMGRDELGFLVSARTGEASYLADFDADQGVFTERFYDRTTDSAEAHDLAREGRLGDLPVSPLIAPTIEAARDRLWRMIDHATGGSPSRAAAQARQLRPAPVRVVGESATDGE